MNFLVTGAVRREGPIIERLESLGHKVFFLQNEADDLPCGYECIQAVICNGLFLYHPINKFITLEYIQLTSAGVDRVPMDYVKKNGITIHNAKGVYSAPMAEFALCGVLQFYKKSAFFHENKKRREWVKNRDILELGGKTVAIFGCGSVGNECAKKFKAFDCEVLGVDIFPRQDELYKEIYSLDKTNEVLPKADVVILTLPLTEQTRNFIDEEKIRLMKKGAIVVNIARGAIVKTKALLDGLKETLGGAVLDVFEQEPLCEDSPFWDIENVIITPHNSFVGEGNEERLQQVIFSNLGEKTNG